MRPRINTVVVIGLLAALCAPGFGQSLLTNGDFEAGGASPCDPGKGWSKGPGSGAGGLAGNCLYNGTTHIMPGAFEGLYYGSTDTGTSGGFANVVQTVTVSPGLALHLSGAYGGWSQANYPGAPVLPYDHFVRIHDGADTSATVIAVAEQKPGPGGTWTPFNLAGVPSSTQVTVAWGYDQATTGWTIVATHVDGLSLVQDKPTCSGDPTVTTVSPGFGANNGTIGGVVVTGTNFDSTSQVILRRSGFADIGALNEALGGGGTTITCDLPITGAAMGKWNVVVTKDLCNEATLPNGFVVAYPALTNGSFEDPTADPSCPNPPTQKGPPIGWLEQGISTGIGHLVRDSDQHPPSCPRPDGDHYAGILVPPGTSFGHWRVYQYLAVTPSQQITVSGKFAGGGRTTVTLELREGDDTGPEIASRTIEDRQGCPEHAYDWVPASVTGTPAGGLVSVVWRLEARGAGAGVVNVTHADALSLIVGPPPAEVCDNGVDDDGDRATDCADGACSAFPGCDPPPAENCTNGTDDDGDVLIDCDDSDCDAVCVEICINGVDDDFDCDIDDGCEICDNGIDDNGDSLVDCNDPTCVGIPPCPSELCNNGTDDDGDLLVDCCDPDCAADPECTANLPFADADNDDDVDQDDFAWFQVCYTGTGEPPSVPGCRFWDRDCDNDIDQGDFIEFQRCTTGPTILWSQALTPECTP